VCFKDIKKASSDLHFAVQHLLSEIKENRLEEGMKHTLCSLFESHVLTFTSVLGYKGDLEKEKEERFKDIREANAQNRELRKQLGEKVSPEDVRGSLKNLDESFKSWWNIEGFGHCSEESFGPYGFKVTLSGMITESYRDRTDPDATEEKKVDKLRAYGFEIRDAEHRTNRKILYNDHNLDMLEQLVKSKYPSADFTYSKAWHGRRHGDAEIRDVEIFIRNFDELFERKGMEVQNG
jgi:hypothetical protein